MSDYQIQQETVIPDKLCFKIGEVCDLVGVSQHVLRYWEREFPQLTPRKNSAGRRVYKRKDVEVAMRIKSLRDQEGLTISGIKKRLEVDMFSWEIFPIDNEGFEDTKIYDLELEPILKSQGIESPCSTSLEMNNSTRLTQETSINISEISPLSRILLRRIKVELETLLTMLQ